MRKEVTVPVLSAEEYRAIFEASPDGCMVVDSKGVIREMNPQVEALFGWPREELVGQSVETLVPEAQRSGHEQQRHGYTANSYVRPMGAGLDLSGLRRDGSRFPAEISLSPWTSVDGDTRVICCVRDVSERKRLQDFSEGMLRATEDERRRIARELHDDTAQRLATLMLRVRVLAEEPDEESRSSLLEEIRQEIVETVEGVKRIARGLRPPELSEVGLAAALQSHLRGLREGAGLDVDLEVGLVDPFLDSNERLLIYRVVQEALSNVMRHADVRVARLVVGVDNGSVFAEVSDSGQGFELGRSPEGGGGLGLLGMQERATMFGARLTIETAPGEGTRVRIELPKTEGG